MAIFACPEPAASARRGCSKPRMIEFVRLTSTLSAGANPLKTSAASVFAKPGPTIVTPSAFSVVWGVGPRRGARVDPHAIPLGQPDDAAVECRYAPPGCDARARANQARTLDGTAIAFDCSPGAERRTTERHIGRHEEDRRGRHIAESHARVLQRAAVHEIHPV